MDFSKSSSLPTLLWFLVQLSLATRSAAMSPPGSSSLTSSRGRQDMYDRPRPERYHDRRRKPPSMLVRQPPPQFPRPVIDPRFTAGRRPFPQIPIKKPKLTSDIDPSDMSNMFGSKQTQCSTDSGMTMESIFSSMFLSSIDLEDLVHDTEADMQPDLFNHFRRKNNRYVEENRFQQTIGTVQAIPAPGEVAGNTCCETRMMVTAPGKVMEDGLSMSVVHMNHSYQYVQEGLCAEPEARCRDVGQCTQMFKYAFLLLYDPQLVGRVNPPVRYGRVQIKSHCECINIGTTVNSPTAK